jgi:hypothetical protein
LKYSEEAETNELIFCVVVLRKVSVEFIIVVDVEFIIGITVVDKISKFGADVDAEKLPSN